MAPAQDKPKVEAVKSAVAVPVALKAAEPVVAAPAKAAPAAVAKPPPSNAPVTKSAVKRSAGKVKGSIKAGPVSSAKSKPKPVTSVVPAKVIPAKPAVKVAKEVGPTVPVPKAASPKAAPKTAPKPVSGKPVFAGLFSNFMLEETTMDMSANFTGFQDAITEAQAKAKAAFEKSTSVLGEVSDFAKGNVEAAVESGKIYAEGVQALGSEFVSESRAAFEKMSGDIKDLAAAKSPTDFFKLQSDLVRKNFDTAVAYSSKNSEAMLKLMSDTFAPISGRVSIAVEKARSAAPF
ncbi:phasin [Novosphingobium guangzhouense]|uniref:Phasin n=1 Tax=Novosphingobium guangzhouense TaxID=1850347 RepID=A0A2K2G4L1_9SPHN|nr:phasin [Novosphingobium guangzhouense]